MAAGSQHAFYMPGGELERRALRSYEDVPLAELAATFELVDSLVEDHKMTVPGGLWLSMQTWRDHMRQVMRDRTP